MARDTVRSARSYERRIDKLLDVIAAQNDRIMYLAGRAWTPAPAELEPPPSLEAMLDEARYSFAPEHEPDEAY